MKLPQKLLILAIFLNPFFSYAAFDAFVFKVEVKYKNGVIIGYVSGTENSGLIPVMLHSESPEEINKQFKANKRIDTLDLYTEIFVIDSLNVNIFFKDKLQRIPISDIQEVKLLGVGNDNAYRGVSNDLHSSDKSWLSKPFEDKEEVYSSFMCAVTVFDFSNKIVKGKWHKDYDQFLATHDLENLTKEQDREWTMMVNEYLKTLEGKHVLIIEECSN